jgi:periplasmic protein TonB
VADKRTRRRIASRIAGALGAIVLVAGFVWFVQTMMAKKNAKPGRLVQTIQVIRPPPPPPDQPPPPPPTPKDEPLPKDQPPPTPDEPDQSANQPLGIDAEGGAGGDAFGLAARHGGNDLVGSGTAPFAWYTNRVRDEIKERLASAACTRSAKGSVSTRVTLAADGRFKQITLTTTTGNAHIDDCVEKVLASISGAADAPPPGMPEQVNLKVVF